MLIRCFAAYAGATLAKALSDKDNLRIEPAKAALD
jgi:hypothetical protein